MHHLFPLIIFSVFWISPIQPSPLGDVSATAALNLGGAKTPSYGAPFPDSGRTQAVLEQESLLSKKDSAYSQLQNFVAGFYNPKPIVDTITEEEKYGNDGDKFRSIGIAVVGGIEGFSNFLNAAVEVPFQKAQQIGKKITNSLNVVGGKLVGLS